jgi:ferritin-like metal-binding protein YciE
LTQQENNVANKVQQYLNEILSIENAALVRLQSRTEETTISDVKQQLKQHLEETKAQQDRLKQLVTNWGGSPTTSKAQLPSLKFPSELSTTLDRTSIEDGKVRDIIKDTENRMTPEKELMRAKEDMIIENAEIISYKMLIQLAEKLNVQDAIPILKQNLQEEEVMATWLMANVPTMLNRLWPYIESSSGNRTTSTTTSV